MEVLFLKFSSITLYLLPQNTIYYVSLTNSFILALENGNISQGFFFRMVVWNANSINSSIFRSRWSSGVGGSGGGSSGRSSAGARDSRRQTRVIRTGRDRGSGLLGSQPQPVIPASVIPEELISQVWIS